MIQRIISQAITKKFHKGKAIVVIGPRQVGKSTLLNGLLKNQKQVLKVSGDDLSTQQRLSEPDKEKIARLIKNYKFVFIDEAQRIKNIGLTAKIITDEFKEVQLILSGSSAFDLNQEINEPLTGRKWEYNLFPISMQELEQEYGLLKIDQQLEDRIIYGMFPDAINYPGEEETVLSSLTNSYLFKDILSLSGIKKPDVLQKLTQALALQIGSEVSYNELAQLIGVNKETISSYIDLLEKAFVVFRVNAFSRNLRNEIKQNKKIYFYDTGLRNALIANFNPLTLRADKGALWENFLIAERIKYLRYKQILCNFYYWRTPQQQEIDWIEERGGKIYAYEFKWKANEKYKFPKSFVESYEGTQTLISRENYEAFVLGE